MGFNSNAVVASGAPTENFFAVTAATPYLSTATYAPGVYRIRAFAANGQATPAASFVFYDTSNTSLASGSTLDWDSASSYNYSELVITLSSPAAKFAATSGTTGYISLQYLSALGAAPVNVTTYTTSQTVTIPTTAGAVLVGGGASGGYSYGGGGGSGYINKFIIGPGSYPLVVGAGGYSSTGGAGTNGGTSTFNSLSAAGGVGGGQYGGAGGAGGSGGGGPHTSNSYDSGGPGGINGSDGTPGGNQANGQPGGVGSGVKMPWWTTAAFVTPHQTAAWSGRGGGIYQGGGGSGYNTNAQVGQNATGIGGGGGGGGQNAASGAGFAGGLIVAVGLGI